MLANFTFLITIALQIGLRVKNLSKTSWIDEHSMEYHMKQWYEPKRSTDFFIKFFHDELSTADYVLDIGSGAGAATFQIASTYPETIFKGIELSPELVQHANSLISKYPNTNLSFELGDWFQLESKNRNADGVISLQTISWIEELNKPLEEIFTKIQPNWVGLSGLFFEGDISCRTEVIEHTKGRSVSYNTYAIPEVRRIAKNFGYEVYSLTPFEIDIDIPKPTDIDILGTYTKQVVNEDQEERIQISGPLLLNWYCLKLRKVT